MYRLQPTDQQIVIRWCVTFLFDSRTFKRVDSVFHYVAQTSLSILPAVLPYIVMKDYWLDDQWWRDVDVAGRPSLDFRHRVACSLTCRPKSPNSATEFVLSGDWQEKRVTASEECDRKLAARVSCCEVSCCVSCCPARAGSSAGS